MAHGIEIRNGKQKIILDETYSNYYLTTSSPLTASVGAAWPPPSVDVETDLILASTAVNSNGFVGVLRDDNPINDTWQNNVFGSAPSSFRYYVAKKYIAGAAPYSPDYGIEVFNSSGQLNFLPPELKGFDVIDFGGWPGANAELTFPGPDAVFTDFDKYFVLINASICRIDGGDIGAEFEWASSTTGRINLETKNIRFLRNQRFMLVKIRD